MKTFACVVLLAAAALAAPGGPREKRGFLSGALSYGHDYGHDYGHYGHEYGHFGHDLDHYDDYHVGGLSSLAHAALHDHVPSRIITKVVEVPRVVEVRKVVSLPRVVKVARVVAEPYGHAHSSWW